MAGRRKYDQGCAVAHALDLVGERWALLVVRDLLLGPKRFTDLLAGLPGASPDVLTQRLRELTEAGVLHRRRLSPPAASWVYELTPWGADLAPIVVGLAQWASRSPGMRYDAPLGTDSLMLSLKALFDSPAAADLEATIAVHLGDERFQIRIADGELTVSRGEIDDPDATLETDQSHPALVAAHRPPARRGTRQREPPPSRGPRRRGEVPAPISTPAANTDRRPHVIPTRWSSGRYGPHHRVSGKSPSDINYNRVGPARPARVDHRPATQCCRNVQLSKLGI